MYRITSDYVEQLRRDGYDLWTIALWEEWLSWMPQFEAAVSQIEPAFRGVALGDGIGLREADAIDEYAPEADQAEKREQDEKHDWRKIDSQSLNRNYVAPTYFDARGFLFHLPAFLLAELNGEYEWDFIGELLDKHPMKTGWIGLLDQPQRKAIIDVLEVLRHHPSYYDQSQKFDLAIGRIRRP
jgi:hypothetical protein